MSIEKQRGVETRELNQSRVRPFILRSRVHRKPPFFSDQENNSKEVGPRMSIHTHYSCSTPLAAKKWDLPSKMEINCGPLIGKEWVGFGWGPSKRTNP